MLLAAAKPAGQSDIDLTGDDDNDFVSLKTRTAGSRKRTHSISIKAEPVDDNVIVLSDSEDGTSVDHLAPKCTRRAAASSGPGFNIKITRQCRVKTIIELTEIPKTWTVPREEGVAY